MPLSKILFKPGVNKENTRYTTEGGWYEVDKVRFRQGSPEVIGGWQPFSAATFQGVCRSLWNWITLGGNNLIGVGTNLKFYINQGGLYYDITPIRATSTINNNPFVATNGSTTITVTDTNHGALTGDFVTFSSAVSLGGNITDPVLNAQYQILNVINANSYTFTATATNASGTSAASNASAAVTPAVPTCAQGGECVVGNTGPGGGTVFYVAAATFASTGSNCSTAGAGGTSTCLYLEAESSIIRTGFWCSVNTAIGATAQSNAIGGGMSNTNAASFCTTGAIRVALDYSRTVSGVTYSDWHLPSFDELAQLYGQRNLPGIDIFSPAVYYWSSTELSCCGGGTGISARVYRFNDGATNISAGKTGLNDVRIRVVRAFGPTN